METISSNPVLEEDAGVCVEGECCWPTLSLLLEVIIFEVRDQLLLVKVCNISFAFKTDSTPLDARKPSRKQKMYFEGNRVMQETFVGSGGGGGGGDCSDDVMIFDSISIQK